MTPALSLVHITTRLQEARERVAHGWPSLASALAGSPISTAQARISEAEAARYAEAPPAPWVLVLTEALALVEEAREMWDSAPDTLPPMTTDLAPCGVELRLLLPDAQAAAGLAWEDPLGLTRPQALCVVHLAVCLAQWRALEQRSEATAMRVRTALEHERAQRATVAAKAIWGGPAPRPAPTARESGPRSLRDLASVSSAFSDWGEDEES